MSGAPPPPDVPGPQRGMPNGTPGDERLGDPAVWAVLQRYAALAGAALRPAGDGLHELVVPPEDRAAFGGRARVRLAFSVDALQADPEAEMAVAGSAFVEQLVAAVRRRGARHAGGLVPASIPSAAGAAPLPAPVSNGAAGLPSVREGRHPVGRLTARVTVRAGASVAEHLVESGLFDLATGAPLGPDVAAACERAARDAALAAVPEVGVLPPRPVGEVVPLMLADLEARLAPDVARQREAAARALAQELSRIDRYYAALLADAGGRGTDVPDAEARRAFEAEHRRRRDEEVRRHEVRAAVHPLQLAEWVLPVQRAEWPLRSRAGHAATLVAQRALVGDGAWSLACPTCGAASPAGFVVCRHAHAGCTECSAECAVCDAGFCRDHGLPACHVDGRPACDAHARTCRACRRAHCAAHEGVCDDGGHAACTPCLAACAHCGRVVCDAHAASTAPGAPLGVRRLCGACVRHCEGGTGEVVGPDETAPCASCGRVVCARHQTTCAVDGQVHCSAHVRRTDRSRRLVCERDRAACAHEPNAVFAADEISACATCGLGGCDRHLGTCAVDGRRHCTAHLVPLGDVPGGLGCGAHHTVCHVDGRAFSPDGTAPCPVCAERACDAHRRACGHCGRSVCAREFGGAHAGGAPAGDAGRSVTCRQLAETRDPGDGLLLAASAAQGGRARGWRTARDATHTVFELDLGWTRRLVLAVAHGADRADVAVAHSLLGSRRVPVTA